MSCSDLVLRLGFESYKEILKNWTESIEARMNGIQVGCGGLADQAM